jgi:hypothetical protein
MFKDISDPINFDAVAAIYDEKNDMSLQRCNVGIDCTGDSVQSKVQGLLRRLYPDLPSGDMFVEVTRGQSHGTAASKQSQVQHGISSFVADIDTSDLPPSAVNIQGSKRTMDVESPVTQNTNLPKSRAEKFHFDSLQGDYDREWRVTFRASLGDVPQLSFSRECSYENGKTPEPITAIGAFVRTETLRQGSTDTEAWDARLTTRPGEATTWPAWVTLFNTTDPPPPNMSVAESRSRAIWSAHLNKTAFLQGRSCMAVLRVPALQATYLRIQRADRRDVETSSIVKRQGDAATSKSPTSLDLMGYAPLAITEVELFEDIHSPVHEYKGSSPLPANTAASPFAPAIEPFSKSFEGVPTRGRWVLIVRDITRSSEVELPHGVGQEQIPHSAGSISHWQLHLTDVLGNTHSFNMDASFAVTTLPKHGHIFIVHEGDKKALATSSDPKVLSADIGKAEWRTACPGVDTSGLNGVRATEVYRDCSGRQGVGIRKGMRSEGSVALRHQLRRGLRQGLVYVPRLGYTGPDSFEFQVTAGAGLASTPIQVRSQSAAVSIAVKNCRQRGGGVHLPFKELSALCICASDLLSVSYKIQAECLASISMVCKLPNMLTTNSNGINLTEGISSPVTLVAKDNGRCDPLSGVCALDRRLDPDKVIKDPRLTSATRRDATRAAVPVGFARMCRACENANSIGHLSRLEPRCWAEWSRTMSAYGIRVGIGSGEKCISDVQRRSSFNHGQCPSS